MAINNITGFPGNQTQRGGDSSQAKGVRQDSRPQAPAETQERPRNEDTVSLTSSAERLRSLEERLTREPVVDEGRVAEIRQALDDGSFSVDPGRIAEKMLAFEREL